MVIFGLVLLGLAFGSFVNALVWRLHEQEKPKKKRAASDAELSIAKGRSMCPHCKHTLAWYDLLPVVSWVGLGGKCRYCKKSISWQYPTVELLTAVLFVGSYAFWPVSFNGQAIWEFVVWLIAVVALVALVVYDIRWMLLPNRIVFPLIALSFAGIVGDVLLFAGGIHVLLMAAGSLAIAGGLFYVLFQMSNGRWIGGGDVKLGFALGLLLEDPVLALLMLFTASILGLLFSLPGLALKRSVLSSKIPFGPFLIAATIIVKLFGHGVVHWYAKRFLYL